MTTPAANPTTVAQVASRWDCCYDAASSTGCLFPEALAGHAVRFVAAPSRISKLVNRTIDACHECPDCTATPLIDV